MRRPIRRRQPISVMLIPLDQLEAHPANANVMPEHLLAKLEAHIRATGRYPPLIVRPLAESDRPSVVGDQPSAVSHQPLAVSDQSTDLSDEPPVAIASHADVSRAARFQILDGHHRAAALRRLGHREANCEIWTGIDDAQAAILLLTLNRLRGEDDPTRRGALLESLSREFTSDHLARLLPDDAQRIERLIALTHPPVAPPDELPDLDAMPQAVTFFLRAGDRQRVLQRLREIHRDRNRALMGALGLKTQ